MKKLDIMPKATALLVMDCHVMTVNDLTPSEEEKRKFLANLRRAIAAARKVGMTIIYVVVGFREGYPEISDRNVMFRGIKERGRLREGDASNQICPEISPQAGDIIVNKKRMSAFTGSDLEVVLRSKGIDTMVLTGLWSLGVIESTARAAFDMDYRVIVLSDACTDRTVEAHEIAMQEVLPRTSAVYSVADFENAVS